MMYSCECRDLFNNTFVTVNVRSYLGSKTFALVSFLISFLTLKRHYFLIIQNKLTKESKKWLYKKREYCIDINHHMPTTSREMQLTKQHDTTEFGSVVVKLIEYTCTLIDAHFLTRHYRQKRHNINTGSASIFFHRRHSKTKSRLRRTVHAQSVNVFLWTVLYVVCT